MYNTKPRHTIKPKKSATVKETFAVTLEGSPKQINWAKAIKRTLLEDIDNRLAIESNITHLKELDFLRRSVCCEHEAKFLIDNRDTQTLALLELYQERF